MLGESCGCLRRLEVEEDEEDEEDSSFINREFGTKDEHNGNRACAQRLDFDIGHTTQGGELNAYSHCASLDTSPNSSCH